MRPTRALGAAFAVAAASATLAACSPSDGSAGTEEELRPVSIQFGWLPNVENMATIVAAEKGYFEEEGLDLTILPGGPDVVADAQIVSGNALMGILSSEALANSVINGADLVAVGATYQTSPSAIVTLADSGIDEPQDLEGRTFGISQTDMRVYEPFFEMVGVDVEQVEMVNTGADPAALVSGEVDAMSGTLANQPIAIRAQGIETREIPLSEYGYNRWSGALVVRADALEDEQTREDVMAMARAIERGLEDAVADPEGAGQIVQEAYGEELGLEPETQVEGARVWASLTTAADRETGLLQVTEEGVASQQEFFDSVGLDVQAAEIFDVEASAEAFGD